MSCDLNSNWVLWFLQQPKQCDAKDFSKMYEEGLIKICEISSSSNFQDLAKYLIKPNKMKNKSNIYLFREGIRPLWEEHKNGGCLRISLGKGSDLTEEYWKRLIDGCGQGVWSNSVAGISLVSKFSQVTIQIWISNAQDTHLPITQEIKTWLKSEEVEITLSYHDQRLQDINLPPQ